MTRPCAVETACPGEIELRCPLAEGLVDALKAAIPARHRRGVPEAAVAPHDPAVDLAPTGKETP